MSTFSAEKFNPHSRIKIIFSCTVKALISLLSNRNTTLKASFGLNKSKESHLLQGAELKVVVAWMKLYMAFLNKKFARLYINTARAQTQPLCDILPDYTLWLILPESKLKRTSKYLTIYYKSFFT
mmetsp:Transcript_69683/g.81320  ORF Transcript_69683/g.81320 Transcript_69683/m.81320 type:complete len:125 (-) Transcript_69683:120-494(-)